MFAVYNEGNQSSKAIAPVYDQLAWQLARPGRVGFAKVSVVGQATIAQSYSVTKYALLLLHTFEGHLQLTLASTPTFIIFKNKQQIRKYGGSNPQQLSEAIKSLAAEAENEGGSGGFGEASSS